MRKADHRRERDQSQVSTQGGSHHGHQPSPQMGEVVERCLGRIYSTLEELCVIVGGSVLRFDRNGARSV